LTEHGGHIAKVESYIVLEGQAHVVPTLFPLQFIQLFTESSQLSQKVLEQVGQVAVLALD